jgi:hypothetical protein
VKFDKGNLCLVALVVLHRGRILRPISSITHLGLFAPNQGHDFIPKGPLGLRKDVLSFASMKDTSQAATILANYLGIEVVPNLID